ncbi:Ger(x)C family spore germination protein [Clostridium sp. C8-1-8]|uniref:Ger(x)C family spore germination protein n=1 Tax=Clostridium sp. C8-1-8 TaxID=2698831 RepID=UPI001369A6D6|nr:Ger(x)C family spore germination protein [Clostridium sp. C8-1-8]
MRKSKVIFIIIAAFILVISFIGSEGELVENLELLAGVGADVEKKGGEITYVVPLLTYSAGKGEELVPSILTGKATTIGETREDRQLESDKKLSLGVGRVYVMSEEAARTGIRQFIDINMNNAFYNDRTVCVVCKGKAKDMLAYKIPDVSSSVEFIEGMIKNLKEFNFFSMQYTTNDIIVRLDAEGREVLLPYIEIVDDKIKTTGIAIFDNDKMVAKANIREAKVINMLKENRVKGIITLQQDSKQYINVFCKTKRKIKCTKEDGRYKFTIDLKVSGEIISNELYRNLNTKKKYMNNLEEDLKAKIDIQCNSLINDIHRKYGVDVLDLGRVAAATYGRNIGKDWNKVVSDSDIKVNVKVKIKSLGRGDY